MNPFEILLDALAFYQIEILSIDGNHVKLENNFEVETETNGLYKLFDNGYIIAPFTDINELCRFILR